MKRDVTFASHGMPIAGYLFLPDNYEDGRSLPGVVITGAWTTVKEQMPSIYAAALAKRGFAALVFDFRGWGQSPGNPPFMEDPSIKTQDILAALEFLATCREVNSDKIGGLGICASSGYMSDAALQSPHLKSLALVAPWLHDAEIAKEVYGGEEGVTSLIETGRAAAESPDLAIVEAASTTNEKALMFQVPYYTENHRGLIPEYDNKFNVASWEPWLTYNAFVTPQTLSKPTLLVHSESAVIPQGAKKYAEIMGECAQIIWLSEIAQFEFYDRPDAVASAANAVAKHFNLTMEVSDSTPSPWRDNIQSDKSAIATIVRAVGLLADSRNFESLEQLYADEVEVDYTSLAGGEVELKSPQALMSQWASVLPGFDFTQHDISNIQIEIDGDRAVATAKVIATHGINSAIWIVEGDYRYKLQKTDNAWQINSHKLTLQNEKGSRDLLGFATRNAEANPPSYLIRQKTLEAVQTFLKALETKDMEKFAMVWADDAIQHMPYAPEGFPNRVVGKENILNHYATWPTNSGEADFTSALVLYPMLNPEMVFAEFKGSADIIPTQRKYEQSYGGLFHVQNGKIKLFREYFNPGPLVHAFGLDEGGDFHGG